MSSDYQSFGDVLRGSGLLDAAFEQGTFPGEVREPDADELLDPRRTPPRDVCVAALVRLDSAARREGVTPRDRQRIARERRVWDARLRANDTRDALAEGRPDGCWCLGLGSRRPLPHEAAIATDGEVCASGDRGETVRYPVLAQAEPIFCAACDEGREAAAVFAERKARHEAARRQAALTARWREAAIPPEFAAATFESYLALRGLTPSMRRAAETVRTAWPDTGDWLFLTGPVGVGKTALGCIALRALMEGGASGLYVVVPDLLDTIRATYGGDGQATDAQLTESLISADALLLDDLGVEKPSEWAIERLYRVVNARHLAGRRTIITSNLDLAQLSVRLGDRTASRIGAHLKAGRSYIQVEGPDLRMAGLL